jgi:hypothetical protein
LLFGPAACTSDVVREAGARLDLQSAKPPAAVTDCIASAWRETYQNVSVAPYQGGQSVRIDYSETQVLMQVDVLPAEGGSRVILTTPYAGAVWYGDKTVEKAKACAG